MYAQDCTFAQRFHDSTCLDLHSAGVHVARMLIYKIFRAAEWQAFRTAGVTSGAPIDLQDGYIHLSTPAQAPETASKYFAGLADLMLIALDADAAGDALKWEVSRGGDLFPHLYRDMRLSDVVWSQPLPLADGHHVFPGDPA